MTFTKKLLTVSIVALSILSIAACGSSSSSGSSTSSSGNKGNGSSSNPPSANAVFQSSMNVYSSLKNFDFSEVIQSPQGTVNATGEIYFNPLEMEIQMNAANGMQTGAILLPSGFYLKVGTSWMSLPSGSSAVATFQKDMQQYKTLNPLQNLTMVGAETVNGYNCWHLKGTFSGSGITSTDNLWVRQSDYYPVKAVITSSNSSSITITYSNWNTAPAITAPAA